MTETILLVEDEDQVRILLHRVLERRGYTVLVASNGREALELGAPRIHELDLVITDLIMPEKGGAELMRELHALRPDLRCLFMTGYAQEDLGEQELNGAALIEKPFTPAQLLDRVAAIFG